MLYVFSLDTKLSSIKAQFPNLFSKSQDLWTVTVAPKIEKYVESGIINSTIILIYFYYLKEL